MTPPHLSEESLIEAIRSSGNRRLAQDAKDRILRNVVASVDPVTSQENQRYNGKDPIIQFSPMIPAIVLVVLLVAGAGTAVAADRAKPGDALFGIDRRLESVRSGFAITANAKAKIAAEIAEERQEEMEELVRENRADALDEANRRVDDALERAQEAVSEVRSKLEDRGSKKALDALKRVENKLTNVRERHEDDDDDENRGLTEAEVKLFATYALVNLEVNDKKSSFRLETTDRNAIITEIAGRAGLSESAVKAIVKFEVESDDGEATNTNRNGNENRNENRNVNSSESRRWKIEVRVDDGRAEIKTEYGEDRQEWTLQSTDRAVILADVVARTGLATAEVESVWDYEDTDS